MVSVKPFGEQLVAPDLQSPRPAVSRQAFYFTSGGEPIFAWLHQCQSSPRQTHGVILCNPLGHEQVHAHRTMRHLADRLAEAGLSVLRFDYHGTGDSAGADASAVSCATWLANIRDAITWMTAQRACREISLFGLRFGALLAVQAACTQAVSSLILWEPVVRGRTFARELKALSLTAAPDSRQPPAASEHIEAAGFAFARQLLDDVSKVDLLQAQPLCRRALILSRDDGVADCKLARHVSSLGIDSQQGSLAGYADMLAEPHFTKVPHQAIASTVNWLISATDAEAAQVAEVELDLPMPDAAIIPAQACEPEALVPRQRIRDKIVHFCRQPDLFGILSEPVAAEQGPLIVLPNAGSTHHIGPGRLHVILARHLAGLGFRCLRFDLSGLGDSITTDLAAENDPYPETAFRDIDITLRFAQQELGAERVVLMGLCSGAYFAFQSAAQLANPVLAASVLINPLTFYWKTGWTLEASPAARHSAVQYYLASALQPRKWLKFLSGRTKIGVVGGFKILGQRFGPWRPVKSDGELSRQDDYPAEHVGHPLIEDLPADLHRAVGRGRQLACFFSQSDPGYGILTASAKRKVKQLCRAGKMSLHFIENADHTFSRWVGRQALVDGIASYLLSLTTLIQMPLTK